MIHRSASNETSLSFFTIKNSLNAMLWSGPVAGIEGVKEIFGIQNVFGIEELPDAVASIKGTIFSDFEASHCSHQALAEVKKAKPLAPFIQQLRICKEPEEVALLKRSAEIASESFTKVSQGKFICLSSQTLLFRRLNSL